MNVDHLVEVMGESLQRVEESVVLMGYHSSITKVEQVQMMQAVLELSERVKRIEALVEISL
jgi:nicotinamide mononucleotide adenylyltransferase